MTLAEALVATAVFSIITLALIQFFEGSRTTERSSSVRLDLQQRARAAFDGLVADLREAGADYDPDGLENPYPNHPDEQIEYVADRAIVFRANFDATDTDGGREPALERSPGDEDFGAVCCPIVSTGNDEIVGYALRSANASANDDEIVFRVDVSAPRDAGWDPDTGAVTGEEEIVIGGVDLSGANPPYSLIRFSLDDDGGPLEGVLVEGLQDLIFSYEDGDGSAVYCAHRADDGTCPPGDQVAFATLAGDDDVAGGDLVRRAGRAAVRTVRVDLQGIALLDDPVHREAPGTPSPRKPRLQLNSTIVPQNLGLRGKPDLDAVEAQIPTNVTICGGQCDTVRVEWDLAAGANTYAVSLFVPGEAEPFFVGVTPGVTVLGADPPRVFAVYQRLDSPAIVLGRTMLAQVQSRTSRARLSPPSDPSASVTLTDVVRPDPPAAVEATGYDPAEDGWPDVVSLGVNPVTDGGGPDAALTNGIAVSWEAPRWALNVADQGDPLGTWTTSLDSSTLAALACANQEVDLDGDTVADVSRTRLREMFGAIRYYVFRSTNKRFVPAAADLVASIAGDVDPVTGRVTYRDAASHVYRNATFDHTANSMVNCRTYYYRVRAADACFSGTEPHSRTDPHLSPFHPPLNTTAGVRDSDDISGLASDQIGIAIPGFSLPESPLQAPGNIRFRDHDTDASDGDGLDATIAFDAVKRDATEAPPGSAAPEDVAIAYYAVFSHATESAFSLADAMAEVNGVRRDADISIADIAALRIERDDEDGSGAISAAEDESTPPSSPAGQPVSGLRIGLESDGSSRWYRMLAVQCDLEHTYPADDATANDRGPLSEAVRFPCDFGGGPSSTVVMDASAFDRSVFATAYPENPAVPATRGRLILADPVTGERTMSASPGVAADGSGVVVFGSSHIAALTNDFPRASYVITVEMADGNGCTELSNSDRRSPGVVTCCMTTSAFAPASPGSAVVSTTTREVCSDLDVRITQITLSVDNASGGAPERLESVSWGTEVLWTGSSRNVIIDRSSSPLVLAPTTSQVLQMTFNRSASRDVLVVEYAYTMGGAPGTCTFERTIE